MTGTLSPGSTMNPGNGAYTAALREKIDAIPTSIKKQYELANKKLELVKQQIQQLMAKKAVKNTKHLIKKETYSQCNLNGEDSQYRIACIQPGKDNRILTLGGDTEIAGVSTGPYKSSNNELSWHDGKYCWYIYGNPGDKYYTIRWNSQNTTAAPSSGPRGRWEIISTDTNSPNSKVGSPEINKLIFCTAPNQADTQTPPSGAKWERYTGTAGMLTSIHTFTVTVTGDAPVAPPTQETCTAKGCCWDQALETVDFKNYVDLPRRSTQCYYPNVGVVGGNIYSDGADALLGCRQAGFTDICAKNEQPPTCTQGFTEVTGGVAGSCASDEVCQTASWTTPSTSTTVCAPNMNRERADDPVQKRIGSSWVWKAQPDSAGMSSNNLVNAWTQIALTVQQQWCGKVTSTQPPPGSTDPPTYVCTGIDPSISPTGGSGSSGTATEPYTLPDEQQVPPYFARKLQKMSGKTTDKLSKTHLLNSISAADAQAICRHCSISDDEGTSKMTCDANAPQWWINFGNWYANPGNIGATDWHPPGNGAMLNNVLALCGSSSAYCCNRAGNDVGLASTITNHGNVQGSKDAAAEVAAPGFVGCYQDTPRVWPSGEANNTSGWDPATSRVAGYTSSPKFAPNPKACINYCSSINKKYAGFTCPSDGSKGSHNGINCWCGDMPSTGGPHKLADQQCSGNIAKKSLDCSLPGIDAAECKSFETDITGGTDTDHGCMGFPTGTYTMDGYRLGGGLRQAIYDVDAALGHTKTQPPS